VTLALLYNFINGFQGSGSSVATIIASRALHPRLALWLTAVSVFFGPFLFGIAVAETIGAGIIIPSAVNSTMILAALGSAVSWSLLTWYLGIPSSPSHALVGGLVGTVIASGGFAAVQSAGILKVLLSLFLSPVLGLLFGMIIMNLVLFLARNASMKISWWFKRGQLITALILALANGANDAPKGMGIMVLGLISAGAMTRFEVPLWIIASSAAAMSFGTMIGGWRVIKTLGGKFFRIRPVDSFCSQIAAASVILGAALLGGPVSTTQVVSSSILGVGAAERMNKVRWGVAGNIGLTWLVTIPANIALAWGLYYLITWIV
jgi:PiT family inorganic phosphate transporter